MPQKIHKASMLLGKAAKVASKGGNLAKEKGKVKEMWRHKAKELATKRNAPPETGRTQAGEGATTATRKTTLSQGALIQGNPEINSQVVSQVSNQEPGASKNSLQAGRCQAGHYAP